MRKILIPALIALGLASVGGRSSAFAAASAAPAALTAAGTVAGENASAAAPAYAAEELVARNLAAHGGLDKIKAIKSMRTAGRFQQGGFKAQVGSEGKAPNLLRRTFTTQGMTEITAYDGSAGWKISPFEGRKDPELLGEDDLRGLVEDADFYGPLVDYKEKGNKIESLGRGDLDGDDVLRLKVTLKNGDIFVYDLDPDTFLEIRVESTLFIRGAIQEGFTDMGDYKEVAGVYFPFSYAGGSKGSPGPFYTVTLDALEAGVAIEDGVFKMPAPPAAPKESVK